MIITRKIEVYISEKDKDEKKNYIHTVYDWRYNVRRAANVVVSHKFVQQNIRDFIYLKDEIKDEFYVKDIIKDGKGFSEQNTTYRILSDMLKGKVPADIYSCLNQAVAHTFKETLKDVLIGKASVRSYKNNIPIPFSGKSIADIHKCDEDGRFYFKLFGIPFCCRLGRDRSNNQSVIERCIAGEYKICGSSLQIVDEKDEWEKTEHKMFLLLCVDIPKKETKLEKGRRLFAFLGVMNPVQYAVNISAKQDYDSGLRMFNIGTADEFNYRRRQIQEAVKRCMINNRYSVGGKGRKRKCQAVERFKDKENNYVDTKLHTYSRMLVDAAVKHNCDEIVLMNQTHREEKAKADNAKEDKKDNDEFVLRNWSYYGLKTKIEYKAKQYGIKLTVEA